MVDWTIRAEGYDEEQAASLGNRFLIGNGYLGIRGTLEEYEADKLPAVNLAGVYDQVGNGWREPVNAPNGCFSYLKVDGEKFRLPEKAAISHAMELDYRHGIFSRHTTWNTSRGNITLTTQRIASMQDVSLIGMRFEVHADFHADVELVTGIDGKVWDLNGSHLEGMELLDRDGDLLVTAITHEKHTCVAVADSIHTDYPCEIKIARKEDKILHRVCFITRKDESCVVEKWVSVQTGQDYNETVARALEQVREKRANGYRQMMGEHKAVWEKLWKHSEVLIEGDDAAMEATNYSLYHLHCIAPRHTQSLSIPARGLSGQTYKGAVFWDTEMFMLDFFLMTDPATARTLMRYRIDTLGGALQKAAHYGFDGAFYAWESQEGGYDACTDYNVTDVFTGRPVRTYFKDKQVHISAAVVYGIMRYVEWTGDESILDEQGIRTVIECAKFYYSLLLHRLTKDYYEIHDVIGPDEYHERINNNGYTNRMAIYTMEKAAEVIRKAVEAGTLPSEYNGKQLLEYFEDGAKKLYLPKPDKNGIVEQFDGYLGLEDTTPDVVKGRLLNPKEYWGGGHGVASQTQVIKQADVVTWLNLFHQEYSKEILQANWNYYEPRTEHGSSLSAGMYAMLACRIDQPDKAYPFFMKSAMADLKGGGKEWAGLVYIGGTHPAAAGAAYMTAVEGFAGLEIENGKLICHSHLPATITDMKFRVSYLGTEYSVHVTRDNATITEL